MRDVYDVTILSVMSEETSEQIKVYKLGSNFGYFTLTVLDQTIADSFEEAFRQYYHHLKSKAKQVFVGVVPKIIKNIYGFKDT